jgi:TetR/AcrR family transcriptional repressor of nem operon
MIPESETTTAILDAAECLVRTGGYGALDHDEVAKLAGCEPLRVKLAFPERADLGVAVARRYTETVLSSLGAPDDRIGSPIDRLQWLIRMLRRTLGEDGRMCPCGTLAGEAAMLPPAVAAEVRRYFERIGGWIARLIGQGTAGPETRARAMRVLATLQGGMAMARLERDPRLFDQITAGLAREALRVPTRSFGNANADRPWPTRARHDDGQPAVW